ncbi:MAG: pyrroline-5-carboxylate reductase [Caldilineaceae bacterium]|nr:pyrroline-5-carboxylate reductase [Caldilineaceae bacterium]
MLKQVHIAFIGSGVMGEAMIKGLLSMGLTQPNCITASDPWLERLDYLTNKYGVNVTPDNVAAVREANIVVLSIKPQSLPKVGRDLHSTIHADALVLSIIAGTRISTLQNKLFHDRIVRAMPNTPGQLGKGMTVWTATSHVNEDQLKQTGAILGAMGEHLQVEEESFLDMATGLSGSGPGFVLLLIEAMIDAGVHMGFSRREAETLVLQTIEGTVALMRASGKHSAELKNQVTSPGGTTAAGLYELEKASIRAIIADAIFAAYRRSQELGALSEQKDNS